MAQPPPAVVKDLKGKDTSGSSWSVNRHPCIPHPKIVVGFECLSNLDSFSPLRNCIETMVKILKMTLPSPYNAY